MPRFLPARFLTALFACALIDMYGLSRLFRGPVRIDIWVVFLVYYALFYSHRHAVEFALLIGIVRDALGHGVFGVSMLGMFFAAVLLRMIAEALDRERWYVQMIATGTAALVLLGFELMIQCAVLRHWEWAALFGSWVGIIALCTALLSPVLLKVFQWCLGRVPAQFELFS